jgi:hypothetical protein
VSCVVSGGEQGLPVGLWRISDDQVLEIDQHFVKMTKAVSYQEQSQRFLSPIKTILPPSFSLTFLTELGYEQKHPFYQALLELQQTQNEVNPENAISFELFKKILETALRIGSVATLRSELESFIKKIEILRSLDNAVSVVFYSDSILNRITVRGDTAYSTSIGVQKLVVCDFIFNRYINIDLPQQISPLDIEIKDNTIWMLVSTGKDRFALLKLAIPATGFQKDQDSHFSPHIFALNVSSPPIKLLSFEDNLWLHCANGVYNIEKELLNEKNTIISLSPVNVPSKAFENCVWVKGSNGIFISNNSGELKTISPDGIVKERGSFPKRFEDAKVIDACNSVNGIYVILTSHDKRTLILIDKKNLEIKWQYLSSKLDYKDNLHSFAIDANTNRVFLQLGEHIVLLTDTGSSSPLWYHSNSKKNIGTVYLMTQDKWK